MSGTGDYKSRSATEIENGKLTHYFGWFGPLKGILGVCMVLGEVAAGGAGRQQGLVNCMHAGSSTEKLEIVFTISRLNSGANGYAAS